MLETRFRLVCTTAAFALTAAGACGANDGGGEPADGAEVPAGQESAAVLALPLQDSTDRVAMIEGLSGPEAVRYDPGQDVYFVSNFNGAGDARDGNGFISRAAADGSMEELRFMVGTEDAPLHAPRGMYLVGDTLWVADADGIHGFHRGTGSHLAFVDLSSFNPGFLNDVAAGPDEALYVTDTGEQSRIFRVTGHEVEVAMEEPRLGPPNGITWDAAGGRFLVAPWGPGQGVHAWRPTGDVLLELLAPAPEGQMDGIEVLEGQIIVASQSDRTLHVVRSGQLFPAIAVPGDPADIGIDTRRGRVAVPYIDLDRVDVWEWRPLPVPQESP
ncbi:MAG: hypothetical protein HKN73_07425 [Gemmatimonadetes bacterium]|nr:hypothetical protein [Gemmatimonadota bacterium]